MESQVQIDTQYKLSLTSEEADWLKEYMQNAHSDAESELDSTMRQRFFQAIVGAKL